MRLSRPVPREIWAMVLCMALILAGCKASTAPTPSDNNAPSKAPLKTIRVRLDRLHRLVRSNGSVQAVNSVIIRVPQIEGQGGDMTLTNIIPGGTDVKAGDVLAEFDHTKQLDNAREAQAKYEDLRHQVDQRIAQHRADAEKRAADLQQATADLSKAELELRKGPILSEIDRLKNQAKLEDAQAHVTSLKRSQHFHDAAEASDLKILELQRDRQKIAWDRAESNADKLVLKAPLPGMVAKENSWHNDNYGPAQEGDQLWPGSPLLRIFDPSEMEVQVSVNEPDGAAIGESSLATVRLDAYPELTFKAHFDSASPVATALLDSVVRSFDARFRLDERDPHLLPDLSAAVDLEVISKQPAMLVPRVAVHYRQGKPYVTRVTGPASQEERAVQVGQFNDTWIEIAAGLGQQDQILSPVDPRPDAPQVETPRTSAAQTEASPTVAAKKRG